MSRSDEDVATREPAEAPAEETEPGAGRNRVLVVSVVAVVVLVVAGIVAYLLVSGDDSQDQAQPRDVPTITGSAAPTTAETTSPGASVAPPATATGATGATSAPRAPADVRDAGSVADQVATAISGADVTTLNELSCEPGSAGTEESFPADAKAEVVGEPKITGDTATVDLKITIGQNEPTTVPMPLTKKDGRWCVP
ncbi:hypothetical protein [Actinophytocola sp. NPDC049390]|uniref:hypothetical protein n=1 Tax=Actinophytocola sp. NPDC049390 TaxID=3363894 RepID=UPI00379DD14A